MQNHRAVDLQPGADQIKRCMENAIRGDPSQQAVQSAELEANRTINRAYEKAESKKETARQKAAASVSKAEETAAQRRDIDLTRAANLRDHANFDPQPPVVAPPGPTG